MREVEKVLVIVFSLALIIPSIIILYSKIDTDVFLKKRKTLIQASCVDYYTVNDEDSVLYVPIYTYMYNSKEYSKIEGLALENEQPIIGSIYSIYIDSKKPSVIVDENSSSSKLGYVFAFILIAVAIIVLYLGL